MEQTLKQTKEPCQLLQVVKMASEFFCQLNPHPNKSVDVCGTLVQLKKQNISEGSQQCTNMRSLFYAIQLLPLITVWFVLLVWNLDKIKIPIITLEYMHLTSYTDVYTIWLLPWLQSCVYRPLIPVLRFKPHNCYKPRRGWTWGKSGWWSRSRLQGLPNNI